MSPAVRKLLAKARAGEEPTTDDKLAAIDTVAEVEWFKAGLKQHGIDTPENLAACARRKIELQRIR